MNVWRIHLRPRDVKLDVVKFCLDEQLVGLGWRVQRVPRDEGDYFAQGKLEYGDAGWKKATGAIIQKMHVDDLVWARKKTGEYLLARVTGPWIYRHDPDSFAMDMVNTRTCEFVRVGPSVAGVVVNAFIPNATLQKILSPTATHYSRLVWNRLTASEHYAVTPSHGGPDFLELLQDDDLEDLIGIYLQCTRDLAVIPSSRSPRNDTIAYEYQLMSRSSGEIFFVQVKGGRSRPRASDYSELPGTVFLFSPAGYLPGDAANVVCIDRSEIDSFVAEHIGLLPPKLRVWFDFAKWCQEGASKR
jgi:hypothetical protein